ncbi:cyclic nucleotide-binding domain-containing protein [Pontibacter sp. G13]|uniref:cyclic nucleotide-binding domain-containing protein n=1 Tax=Pontibacter sp. G13 TaxID=3074898 RepID=UPI00288BE239|nr:cyclic nucleotide-binding domain-containing protein [Pontibacter sp. G13]WNJ21339.1 cyclic nucleotide-binding domain-containing protein [Pontibacter sp. G13]
MDQTSMKEALKHSNLFSGLDDQALEIVARKTKVRQFFPGDIIVWQGQPSTALFLIVNGIVAVKRMTHDREDVLAYLMAGNTFGEVGILENQARSASVVALSEVDALAIRRDDFLDLLHQYPVVAIELARILGRYLVQSNRRLSSANDNQRMVLILENTTNDGGTSFGTLLAEEMAKADPKPTAYLEYPNPFRVLKGFQLPKGTQVYHHGGGFDILFHQGDSYLPETTRATLLMDKIKDAYSQIVIKVQGDPDASVIPFVEQACQIILLTDPSKEGIQGAERMQKFLKGKIRPEETGVITVVNHHRSDFEPVGDGFAPDFEIPYLADYPVFKLPFRDHEEVADPIRKVLIQCVERMERTNSLGIFIPTTTDVDQEMDTTVHMDQTMSFMAERFGGATCKVASGVWHSEKLGLVGEVIYIVHSYITRSDLNRHLDEVVDYIKHLKRELNQEAMALEVNHKLTLI